MAGESFSSTTYRIAIRQEAWDDYNTENGEIDLVLELTRIEPFWADYGGEVMVECKNWNATVPLKEVGSFAYKVGQARGANIT